MSVPAPEFDSVNFPAVRAALYLDRIAPRQIGRPHRVSLTVDDVTADVIAFCREYPAAASLAYKIRDTQQELFGDQATVERYGILAAAYFPRSRRVDIAASALRDHEEVARTLRHEVLGHYALNTFQPAHKRAILDAIGAARLFAGQRRLRWRRGWRASYARSGCGGPHRSQIAGRLVVSSSSITASFSVSHGLFRVSA
jgi:hypothetical protein